MSEPLTPDEEDTFEFLFSKLTMQPCEAVIVRHEPPPPPLPALCRAQGCRQELGEYRHLVLHDETVTHTCSLPCAMRFSKTVGEKISSHIKVGKFNGKEKVK